MKLEGTVFIGIFLLLALWSCSHAPVEKSRALALGTSQGCELVAHPNGAGWTAVSQNKSLLTEYKENPNDTLNRLVELKERGICGQRALSCDVRLHENGAGYSAVFVKNVLVATYRPDRQESERILKELQDRGICKPFNHHQNVRKCTISYHPNGAGYSAVKALNGDVLTEYYSSIDQTIAKWTDLKEEGICNEYSFNCKIGRHPNGAGYSAVFGDDIQLSKYEASIDTTVEKLAEFKDANVCR